MRTSKWHRQPKKNLSKTKDDELAPKFAALLPYKVSRVKPRKRKKKHPGYSTIAFSRLWIFENNDSSGGKNG